MLVQTCDEKYPPGNTNTNKEAEPPKMAMTLPIDGTRSAMSRERPTRRTVMRPRRLASVQCGGPQPHWVSSTSFMTSLQDEEDDLMEYNLLIISQKS